MQTLPLLRHPVRCVHLARDLQAPGPLIQRRPQVPLLRLPKRQQRQVRSTLNNPLRSGRHSTALGNELKQGS